MAFADEEFLDALPALRRAFSVFTPREKDRLARGAAGRRAAGPVAAAAPVDAGGDARARGAAARARWRGTGCGRERRERRARWRLVLGERRRRRARRRRWTARASRGTARSASSTTASRATSATSARGSLDDSALSVPDWINDVHELFPRRVVERLERDALERYGLLEIVTDQRGARSARRPT